MSIEALEAALVIRVEEDISQELLLLYESFAQGLEQVPIDIATVKVVVTKTKA